jgi:hypothetical protein
MRNSRILFILFLVFWQCTEKNAQYTLFEMLDKEHTNIEFNNKVVSSDTFNIIEYLYFYNGGGVAIGDINNDDLPDVYFTSNQGSNKLYLNKGNFKFEDITLTSGTAGKADWSTGVTMADVNGDGFLDIYVNNVSDYKGLKGHNELFINNGDLSFTESAANYGLDFKGFGTQAVFFDYDRDNDLDVYLLNHSVHDASSYGPASLRLGTHEKSGDRLLKNLMSEGEASFTDVTNLSGIYSSRIGYGLGVKAADINNDGWPDLYISNDFHENDYLYINQGDGTFTEDLQKRIAHTSRYSMGNNVADMNNDGLQDIITLDMLPDSPDLYMKSAGEDKWQVSEIKSRYGYAPQVVQNTLQKNIGDGMFIDVANYASISASDWSWSPLPADFDRDGYKDLFITNGIYKRPNDLDYIQYLANIQNLNNAAENEDKRLQEIMKQMPTLKIKNYMYQNQGDFAFKLVSDSWGLHQASCSNGAAYGDLDNDGDLDLVVNNVNQPAFVYQNNDTSSNFLKVKLRAGKYNTYGFGSLVSVHSGKNTITEQLQSTSGFQSSSEPIAFFGLDEIEKIDSLEVIWPDGTIQIVAPVELNATLTVQKDEKGQKAQDRRGQLIKRFEAKSIELPFCHQENDYADFNTQFLLPYKTSTKGPALAIGDINGDGLDDMYLGGAYGQSSQLLIQINGRFDKLTPEVFTRDMHYEDVAAEMLDFDNDGDLDIFVASGGGQYEEGNPILEDRIYINNNGNFTRYQNFTLPRKNSSCLALGDINSDGRTDVFVGADFTFRDYGKSSESYLLLSTPTEYEIKRSPVFNGMITDAKWKDYDRDGDFDLIIAGHWMPIIIAVNDNLAFNKTVEIEGTSGLWNTIEITDVNGDGLLDILAGNIGLNSKLKAQKEKPLKLYISDFDGNGQSEPIIMQFSQGRYIPVVTKDDITRQVSAFNKKFQTYAKYAEEVNGIESFVINEDNKIDSLEVQELKSLAILNNGDGTFITKALPPSAQISSIHSFIVGKNGYIISTGNFTDLNINFGLLDGSYGEIMRYDNDRFEELPSIGKEINLMGQIRNSGTIQFKNMEYFVFTSNNGCAKIFTFEYNLKEDKITSF